MQGISYFQSYPIIFVFLICSVTLIKSQGTDSLDSHAQLLKSFQNEMKSLEGAAQRVHELLMNPELRNIAKEVDNQAASSAPEQEPNQHKNFEFTLLANPSILRNGLLQTPVVTTTTVRSPEVQQHSNLNPVLNVGRFGHLFDSISKVNFQTPWWKGNNVCVEKMVEDDTNKDKDTEAKSLIGTSRFEGCRQTANKYVCTTVVKTSDATKTSTVTYKCCEGFSREGNACVPGDKIMEDDSSSKNYNEHDTPKFDAEHGSTNNGFVPIQVTMTNLKQQADQSVEDSYSSQSAEVDVNIKSLVDNLKELGATDFASTIEVTNLVNTLTTHNVTVFAPVSEDSFIATRKLRQLSVIDDTWNNASLNDFLLNFHLRMQELVLAHVTDSLLYIEDFSNEMVLNSINNSSLRINIYPCQLDTLVFVNCARLTSWDNIAKRSRIHTIDRPLDIVHHSVLDILQQPQFSQFLNYLKQTDLLLKLENISAITILAPTNNAWDQLDEALRTNYDQGKGCLDAVLQHHILPLTLCSAAASAVTTTDIAGQLIRISISDEGEIFVDNKIKFIESDKMGSNGVVHVVERVLIPRSSESLSDLLSYSNHTTFLNLLNKFGLTDKLNKADNLTLFVPTEKVLNEPETQKLLQDMDRRTLKEVLLYHVATTKSLMCDMKDDLQLDTMLEGTKLHIYIFDSIPLFSDLVSRTTVQCAALLHTDSKACHAVAHQVDRLLIPPKISIQKLIAQDPQLSILSKVLEGTDLEYQLKQTGHTFLAPNNEAFHKLDEHKRTKLFNDKKYAEQTIRKHILQEALCCSAVTTSPWPFTHSVLTLQGRKLDVNRNRLNQVMFGSSVAVRCDVMATDGILHVIDKVLMPQSARLKLLNAIFEIPGERIALTGF